MALAHSTTSNRDAALLKASTELFVQVAQRSADEVLRYSELAGHLLPKVTPRERAFVAEMLSDRADAPKAIILTLAKDAIEVAAPILRHSPVLDTDALLAVIAATGSLHRRLIAGRRGLSANVMLALSRLNDPAIDSELARSALPAAEPTVEPTPTVALEVSDATDHDSTEADDEPDYGAVVFLSLERQQRLKTIARQASRPLARSDNLAELNRVVRRAYHAAEIAMMARTGRDGDLVRAFAEGLGLDARLTKRLIEDATGEGLVLMSKAMGLGEREARQVLLLANPHIGQSTELFFRLADLHAGLEREVAERLVNSWRDDDGTAPIRHVPQFVDQPRSEAAVSRSDRRGATGRQKAQAEAG